MPFQQRQYAIRLEPLSNQITVQPVELAIVCNRLSVSQTSRERRIEQRVRVEAGKRLVHCLFRDRRADAGAFDLPFYSKPSALAKGRFTPRDGLSHTAVVD